MKYTIIILSFLTYTNIFTQSKEVLFIGNSYTSVNNLPEIVKVLALSTGDSLIYESHTPGGQTFQGHFSDQNVIQKINSRNWDYVVLQEQSQRPSFPESQVIVEVFPFAEKLDSVITANDSCTETMFYMTWGRKNGDAMNCQYFPPLCTYNGMDSLLYLRYMQMTEDNNAVVSPVGALWHYIRDNYPEIELYAGDESHPSLAGSYAAACSFYSTIFHKNPLLINDDYTLDPLITQKIRNSAKIVVYDSLAKWKAFDYLPKAEFTFTINEDSIITNNLSENSTIYEWYINDLYYSNQENIKFFIENDTTNIKLISYKCGQADTFQLEHIKEQNKTMKINKDKFNIYPNPFENELYIKSDKEIKILEVYDLTGNKLITINNKKSEKIILSSIKEGAYFIKVLFNDNSILNLPLIKE